MQRRRTEKHLSCHNPVVAAATPYRPNLSNRELPDGDKGSIPGVRRAVMSVYARIEDADPRQLGRLLEDALRWLNEEWFSPWLADRAPADLAADLDVDARVQLQRLGTPYLKKRLDEVAKLVRDMTRDLDARLEHPGEAAARWEAAHRRPLSYVVDLYELAASRNAQVRAILERAGWETQAPGLVLSETAEDAMTILYEGLQRLAGLIEDAARGRGAALPAGTDLLGQELTDALADDQRFTEAQRRAWGSGGRGRCR